MNFNKKLVLLGLCIPLAAAAGCSTGTSPEADVETASAIERETEIVHETREDGLTEEDILLLEQTEAAPVVVVVVETAALVLEISESALVEISEAPITPITEEEWFITPEEFRYIGTFNWNGYRWTYYSERVLPGGGLNIPGRWSDTYFVRDGEGNICLASSDLGWGTYVPTPWGQGRVYDSGCASGTLDVYVAW